VVVHEGEPPAHVHTAAGKLWMAALLHKEVWFYSQGDFLFWLTSSDDLGNFQG
jgi:acyl-coenzyme A synthetase/AMP-(fatty) acid ligase